MQLKNKTKGQNHDLLDLYLADPGEANHGLGVKLNNDGQNGQIGQKGSTTVKKVNMV